MNYVYFLLESGKKIVLIYPFAKCYQTGSRMYNVNPHPAEIIFLIFNHLGLCLATAIHNPKWLKTTYFCLIWNIYKCWGQKQSFHSQSQWFNRLIRQSKNDYCRDQQAKGWSWVLGHPPCPPPPLSPAPAHGSGVAAARSSAMGTTLLL